MAKCLVGSEGLTCGLSRCFLEGLISPLQEQMEEWKRGVNTLDKDHAKGGKTHVITHTVILHLSNFPI